MALRSKVAAETTVGGRQVHQAQRPRRKGKLVSAERAHSPDKSPAPYA